VQANSSSASRYDVKTATDGSFHFLLKAANGQVIGRSEQYGSAEACQAGLEAVKANGPLAELKEVT